ncbi:MAG: folate-binding protein [Acidobacteriaceae bacterium]
MSNSIPNQVEAGSTGSTMAGPVSVANSNPETAAADQAVHATPLAEALKTMPSVTLLQYRGAESIAKFSNATDELAALLNNVGVYDLGWRRLIRCTGEDRMRWLNGMVTNFVGNLDENAGCYAFVLNAQGRIQGDIDIYRRHDSIWLETDASQVTALTAFLDHYIIMDDVTLESQPQWTALGVAGPRAAESIAEAGLPVPSSPLHVSETTWQGHPAVVIAAHSPLVPRYEIWMERDFVLPLWNALQAAGSLPCGVNAIESLRVLQGTPAYSVDITAKDLPQETNQMRALHFNKGCYLGQEIVERIHSRGNVHRTFTGFVLADGSPTPGTALLVEGKPVGEITSVARVVLPGASEKIVALGTIRREALERKSDLLAGETVARPSPLPFDFSSEAAQPREFIP